MCEHACSFHKKKGEYRTPCCAPCSCGQSVELAKFDLHMSNCHRIGLDVPKIPINMPFIPPVRVPLEIPVAA